MADLSAVLRKTIDGLPGSSPQLRAKVYDKARSAIDRQIAAANPPLGDEAAQARRDSLEDAIQRTEAHYTALEAEPEGDVDPEPAAEPHVAGPMTPAAPAGTAESVGEIGPSSPSGSEARRADGSPDNDPQDTAIPAPDMAAPRYSSARRASAPEKKSRTGLYAGVALLLIAGGAGAAYISGYDFGGLLPRGGQDVQTAEQPIEGTDSGETPDASVAETPPEATLPAEGAAEAPPAAATPEPGARDYTQRLLPDGTETDPGPGTSTANAFDEGTDVAAASEAPTTTAPPATPPGQPAPAAGAAVPEGAEVAVFYEERFNDTPGAQHQGNVRWSVVQEAPADGQPPEPAVRAVVQIPDTSVTMTMTIRRNADASLPASHVIEMMFDVPENFPGGEIANVQRLAFKPTEQDRGRPLIGVAGKISDGFFWIALNDLQQAVQDNLSLMANEKWIDVPLAYETGQRALLSIEKGAEGEAAFREALAAWDART